MGGFQLGALIVLIWFVSVLSTLLYGSQPRYVTKWACFWFLWLPYGIGYLLLVLFDAPWSKRASAKLEPLPHNQQRKLPAGDRRVTGGRAWLITFVVVAPLITNLIA